MNEVKIGAISNRETYEESFQAIDENGDAIDLTGATITYEIREPVYGGASVLTATDSDGITISTTTFTVRFEVDDMRGLDPKEYDVGCTILLNGDTTQFFIGKLPVRDGVVS